MRAIMISFTIIFFCLSCELLNELNADYTNEIGRGLFPKEATKLGIDRDTMPKLNDKDKYNETLYDIVTPAEQPSGLGLNTIFSSFTYLLKFISFLINVAFNSTIGFFWWVDDLGTGTTIFPPTIVYTVALGVYINYLYCLAQLLSGRSLLGGV